MPKQTQIITVAVIKGGTGKTTTCAALAQAAVAAGKKVLVIDLDPQANCTFALGANQNGPGSYELINGSNPEQLIQETKQGVYVIAGSPDLAAVKTSPGSAKRLKHGIEPIVQKFDLVLIDTPPQMGELTYNALQASTGLLIPLETDSNSLQGLYHIADIANQMRTSNPGLTVLGAILTRYDNRPKINRFIRQVIQEKGAEIGVPYLMEIRNGVSIREAAAMQQSIYSYAPTSKPAIDYKKLYDTITED